MAENINERCTVGGVGINILRICDCLAQHTTHETHNKNKEVSKVPLLLKEYFKLSSQKSQSFLLTLAEQD